MLGHTGWQTHALSNGAGLRKLDPKLAPVSTALGVLGMPGMTAYAGALGNRQAAARAETVVVAAASGAVGSVVGQIAKIKGARAVGIAGGPDKCRYVKDELGFDACLDHRAPRCRPARLARPPARRASTSISRMSAAPCSTPCFRCSIRSRAMPVCGLIAHYNATELPPGP